MRPPVPEKMLDPQISPVLGKSLAPQGSSVPSDALGATGPKDASRQSRAAPTQDGRWLPPDETLATQQSARSDTGDRAETLHPSRYAG